MGRKPSKPKDPTYAAIEAMVAQSGLNATTQEEVVNYSKLFMKAFLERAMQGEMNHFLKEEVRQASLACILQVPNQTSPNRQLKAAD